MQQMNTIHATGANDSARPAGHLGTRVIATNLLTTNLDDVSQLPNGNTMAGIPQGLMPSFDDANGNPTATNLTINVLNNTTGGRGEIPLRYEPGVLPTPPVARCRTWSMRLTPVAAAVSPYFPPPPVAFPTCKRRPSRWMVAIVFRLMQPMVFPSIFPQFDLQPATSAWTGESITEKPSTAPRQPCQSASGFPH